MRAKLSLIWASIPSSFKYAALLILLAGALYGAWRFTLYEGHRSAEQLAEKHGLCTQGACYDQGEIVIEFAADEYKMSKTLVTWCLGVDKWAETRVQRGGFLKAIIVDVMYWPCGKLAQPQ